MLSTSLHVAMGITYIIVGILVIVKQWFLVELEPPMAWLFGILVIAYGVFRGYRGYNFYREE